MNQVAVAVLLIKAGCGDWVIVGTENFKHVRECFFTGGDLFV